MRNPESAVSGAAGRFESSFAGLQNFYISLFLIETSHSPLYPGGPQGKKGGARRASPFLIPNF